MSSRRAHEILSIVLIVPWLLGLLAAAVIFVGECAFWLKHGAFPGWSIATEFGGYPAPSGYLGFDKILQWYLDLRISVAVAIASIIGLVGCIAIGNALE
ncbi:hypothetical protein [Bradyrhizobium sp. LA7.1]|uniref:hypothetical protein n=1 Tax=Bradyrhizobium sp. LA7.1 TaxID=3156324 RepID=UPI00339429A1